MRWVTQLGVAVIALGAGRASAAEPPVARFVVAVGHNQAEGREALRYADDDAARLFELLAPGAEVAELHATLDPESQALHERLRGAARPPTRAALEATLGRVDAAVTRARAEGRRSELFFFYAGHGDADRGRGWVYLADGALPRDAFEALVLDRAGRADRVHVAVDACKSYFLVAGRGPGGERRPAPAQFAGPRRRPGVGYLLSTSSDADAHEWGAVGGGVFSHLVRSALLGAADADVDGRVTYDEIGAFLALASDGVVAGPFRPDVFVRAPPDDARAALPVLDPSAYATVRLGAPLAGRVVVVDEGGLRFAETHKAPESEVRLALLAPRRYELRVGDARYAVTAEGAQVELGAVLDPALAVASRGEAHRALEGLWARPFSASVVQGYRLGLGAEASATLTETPEEETPWLTPTLVGSGAALSLAGGLLAAWSADAHADAGTASQARREALTDRGNVLAYGAVGAFTLGATALTWAILREVW